MFYIHSANGSIFNFFSYKSSQYFWDLNCHQILYVNATDLKLDSSTKFFPALSISSICKLPSIKFKSGQWGLRVKRFSFPTNRIRVPIYFHTRNLLLTVWQVAHAERPHETSGMNVIQREIVHLKKMKNEWHNISDIQN